tara:strand:+ start:17078 stop:17797 length:720 start_codon:yes stop_codon:yes gene_type:complete
MPESGQITTVTTRETQGQEEKLKLRPPIVSGDSDLERIVNHIYDDINRLNQSVNQKMAANTDHTGKIGDIRCVPDPAKPENQLLQAFGGNGWTQFGESTAVVHNGKVPVEDKHSKPDFDSGWMSIEAGGGLSSYAVRHNLDTKILSFVVMFRFTGDSDGTDFDGGSANVDTDDVHYPLYANGFSDVQMLQLACHDRKAATICVGNTYLFTIDNYLSGDACKVIKGEIRVFCYKIPLGKK